MTRLLLVLAVALVGCVEVHTPADAAVADGSGSDASSCRSMALYNRTADTLGCARATSCPACPALLNSAIDCATLEAALGACP